MTVFKVLIHFILVVKFIVAFLILVICILLYYFSCVFTNFVNFAKKKKPKQLLALKIFVILLNIFYFYFILECSWFTMLCQSRVYSRVIQLCMYLFKKIYWRMVHFQCISFRCTAKWISYIYIYTSLQSFLASFPYRLLENRVVFPCCTVGACWLSLLYTVVCIC